MSKKAVEEIKASIKHLTYQINLLKTKIDNCEASSKKYNKLVVQRACLRKKLSNIQSKNNIFSILRNIKFIKKEKNICDYFPQNK